MDLLKCAWINIFRKKARSLITIIGITIGVASVVIINSVSNIGREAVITELGSLGITGITVAPIAGDNETTLTGSDLELIKSLECVKSAIPVMTKYTNVEVKSEISECLIWGVDTGANQVFNMNLLYGRLMRREDIQNDKNVCVVDTVFAEKIYKRQNIVGKTINIQTDNRWKNYEIIGVVSSGGMITQGILSSYVPYFIYLPYSSLQSQGNYGSFNQIAVKIKDETKSVESQEKILNVISQNGQKQFSTTDLNEKKNTIDKVCNMISFILTIIAGISLIIAGLTIMIVMLSGINERTKEIGIKKAIGAKQKNIAIEFLSEAIIISSLGGFFGCFIGVIATISGCLIFNIPLLIDWISVGSSFIFAVFQGGLFGIIPALKAGKLAPVEALM